MIALPNMLNIKIESAYPAVNGSKHYAFILLNDVFRQTFVDPEMNGNNYKNVDKHPTPSQEWFCSKEKLEWFPTWLM
jgi:hypothetical protein